MYCKQTTGTTGGAAYSNKLRRALGNGLLTDDGASWLKQRHRYAYFPFGGGPRFCIGSSFAMLEAQLIVATIAQKYELYLVPEHPVEVEPLVTLRPKFGMMMTLRPCVSIDERTSGQMQRTA